MNPFEVERLGWEEIRGLPVVGDSAIGTGRFEIVCSRDSDGSDLEETEVGLFANQQITAHVEALANLARDAPDSCVCISPLLVRLTPSKFSPFRFNEEKRTSISYVLLLLFLSCILQR